MNILYPDHAVFKSHSFSAVYVLEMKQRNDWKELK